MRQIIEARVEGGDARATDATVLAVVERNDLSLADLGRTLAEGRALLAEVQSFLVPEQTTGWMKSPMARHRCGSMLAHKDARSIVLRTVFGKVDVPSLRLWACSCAAEQGQPRRSLSPLCEVLHRRVTPELEYHKGLPINSSIAESAVNLVVSHRMAKKQKMRWTDEGAHCLAQVRVANA